MLAHPYKSQKIQAITVKQLKDETLQIRTKLPSAAESAYILMNVDFNLSLAVGKCEFYSSYTIFQMRSSANINLLNEYLVLKGESLGKGATGEVFLGRSLRDSTQVAVKVIELKSIDNEVTEYLLRMEKTALMTSLGPHVLRGLKAVQDAHYCYLVTELCRGGSLKSLLKSGPLSQDRSLQILQEIVRGELGLVSRGILHRDLKPANILMEDGHVKIIDFGYCQIEGHRKPSLDYNVGSPSYMAPEAFLENQYNEKTEIWAIGVTFYECINGKTFDEGKNMAEVYRQMRKLPLPYRVQTSDKVRTIIKWCLQLDPKARPTCQQLLDFLTGSKKLITSSPRHQNIVKTALSPRQSATSVRNTAQSLRVSFTPIENLQLRATKPDLRKQQPKGENKIRPIFSSYQPKKPERNEKIELLEEKMATDRKDQKEREKKGSVYLTIRNKYDKPTIPIGKALNTRQKSLQFDPEAVRKGAKLNNDYFGLLTQR